MNAKVNATVTLTSEQVKLCKALVKACQNQAKASAAVLVAICNSIKAKIPTETIIENALEGFNKVFPGTVAGADMGKSGYASMIRRLAAAPTDIIANVETSGKALHPKIMTEYAVPGMRKVSEKALAARAAKAAAKAEPKAEPKAAPIDLAGVLLQMHGIRAALNLKTADQALLECCNAFIANLSMIVTKEKNLAKIAKAKAKKVK